VLKRAGDTTGTIVVKERATEKVVGSATVNVHSTTAAVAAGQPAA
jgi:hypothetical protein